MFLKNIPQSRDPEAIVKERGLIQILTLDELSRIAVEVEANPNADETRNGKDKALGYLVGK